MMGVFLFLDNNAPLETIIDFHVFIVYTEIGNIEREEKLLDHAFLLKKTIFTGMWNIFHSLKKLGRW